MALTSFCGLLTLQVGAAILSAIFFTLAGVILGANIFDYHSRLNGWPVSLLLMLIFVAGLIVTGFLMFHSSYAERRQTAIFAVVVIVALFCYWIILCCFSFVSDPDHINAVCIDTRCPESFWIANLGYRTQDKSRNGNATEDKPKKKPAADKEEPEKKEKRSVFDRAENETELGIAADIIYKILDNNWHSNQVVTKVNNRKLSIVSGGEYTNSTTESGIHKQERTGQMVRNINFNTNNQFSNNSASAIKERDDRNIYFFQSKKEKKEIEKEEDEDKDKDEETRYVYGFPLVGAVVLFLINALFLLFSALIMWSWASELDWIDYYIEDEPVIIYEETY